MGVDVPPSELELSWFKLSLAYGSSSNAVVFNSWHSARQAVKVKSPCFLLEK